MSLIKRDTCPICESNELALHLKCKDHSISEENFDLYKCQNCDFVFTQNVPDEMQIGKYYESEDYISHSDTQKNITDKLYHIARNFMLNSKSGLVQKLAVSQPNTLLDIGSGTGYFLNQMRSKNWEVKGIEVSDDTRNYSIEKFGLDVESIEKLFDLNQRFDVISMWHVLEHVHRLDDYMIKIKSLLKDDGSFVIAVPNHESFDGSYYKSYWAAYDTPRHLWHFSPKQLEQLANKHGFKLVSKKRLPLDSFYVSILSEKYKGNKLALPVGAVIGGISFLKSLTNVDACSSLIYVLQKN